MAGWTGSNNMVEVYVHLRGADIEKKILKNIQAIIGDRQFRRICY
jgi:hypothetical protein